MLSHGVPGFVFRHTDEYFPNDLEDLERKLKLHQLDGGTAAIFVEPVGPESGTRPVSKEFIQGTERLAHNTARCLSSMKSSPHSASESTVHRDSSM